MANEVVNTFRNDNLGNGVSLSKNTKFIGFGSRDYGASYSDINNVTITNIAFRVTSYTNDYNGTPLDISFGLFYGNDTIGTSDSDLIEFGRYGVTIPFVPGSETQDIVFTNNTGIYIPYPDNTPSSKYDHYFFLRIISNVPNNSAYYFVVRLRNSNSYTFPDKMYGTITGPSLRTDLIPQIKINGIYGNNFLRIFPSTIKLRHQSGTNFDISQGTITSWFNDISNNTGIWQNNNSIDIFYTTTRT